ncbi:sensor histidine kinase [Streptomyces alfalfae]|uniref:histidine kinase n=1 Tax=Streptomyces alfalfae TaxID=1642299 RepID=A0A7T4PKV7_9ACTN|nr:sensor histidine kinase [Streptomyces alfalfae]QQC92176.1 sensor histidine kinase [Streptomyces alfalfae]
MSASPPVPLVRSAAPGAWAAASWCLGMAVAARAHLGLPLMPTSAFPGPTPWDWLVIAAALGGALCAGRLLRGRPLTALTLLIACSYAATPAVGEVAITFLQYAAVDIALGFVVATRGARARAAACVLALCALPGFAVLRQVLGLPFRLPHSTESSWSGWQAYCLLAAVAWLIGDSVRRTRVYTERLGAQATAQAVTAERLRIAREMHDTVAHSIGIIALQAGAAARVAQTQPARAREAMVAVETAGRETLAGLRRLLGALRESDADGTAPGGSGDGPGAGREAVPLEPAAGLADVDRLAATTTAAGVRVDVRWRGERRALPPDIDLSAFRIVQEAVTNVVRHADTGSCAVTVEYRDEEVVIGVEDEGRGSAAPPRGAGYGLVGMRERVALLHGELRAAPRPEGGFRVTARLPLPAPAGAR